MNTVEELEVCYPFSVDTLYVNCLSMWTGEVNESGHSACCFHSFMDRTINDWQWDNYIECNSEFNQSSNPLPFQSNGNCSIDKISKGQFIFNATCLADLMDKIWLDSYIGCMEELQESFLAMTVFRIIVNILLFMFGTLFNCSLLFIYSRERSLWKPLNLYITSTVLADQLYICSYLPLKTMEWLEMEWQFGRTVCRMYNAMSFLCLTVIIYTASSLSVERYHIIVNCFQSRGKSESMSTKRRVILVNIAIWMFAVLFSVPSFITSLVFYDGKCYILELGALPNWYWNFVHITETVFLFVVPFSIIGIFNTISFFKLRSSNKSLPENTQSDQAKLKSRDQTAKLFLVIIIIFLICQIPGSIKNFVYLFISQFKTPWERFQFEEFKLASHNIRSINFCSNSIIIFIMSSEVRQHFFNLFSFIFKQKNESETELTYI